MKNLYVKDLKKSDMLIQEMFAVQSTEKLLTKDGKPYVKVFLCDKTGVISGQIWSDALNNVEKGALSKGAVVTVDAKVEEFKGALQLNVLKVNAVNEQYIDEFIEGSSFGVDVLWNKLEKFIEKIKDAELKAFINSVFEDQDLKLKYSRYPAAEFVHHAFQSGLLEHVVEMLEISEPLEKYYPEANFDFVIAGIIFHDIGKLDELERIGVSMQRTTEGYLIGHLIKSFEFVTEKGKGKLSDKNLLTLQHIILSHHGQLEFGSPVKPTTIEAVIVHHIDMTSSQIRSIQRVIRTKVADEQGFTEFDRIAGTRIYTGEPK